MRRESPIGTLNLRPSWRVSRLISSWYRRDADPGGQGCDQDDSHCYDGRWDRSCRGRPSGKPCPSRRQRHRHYKPFQRTRREAAGAAQRSRSQSCPCRGSLRSGRSWRCTQVKEDLPVGGARAEVDYSALEGRELRDDFESFLLRWANSAQMDSTARWPANELLTKNGSSGFALKSRLPSMYIVGEAVEAGGLMSYGRTQRTATAASIFGGQDPEGRQARRPAGRAADEVRDGNQSKDGEADRCDDCAGGVRAGGRIINDSEQKTAEQMSS